MASVEVSQSTIDEAAQQEQRLFSDYSSQYMNKRVVELAALCNTYKNLLISSGVMDAEGNLLDKAPTEASTTKKEKS